MVQIKLASSQSFPNETHLEEQLRLFGIRVSEQALYEIGYDDFYWIRDLMGRKLKIDFDQNKKDYRRSHKGRGEPLAKALGIRDGVRKVLDLTAGLGIDAVFLSQIGFQVTALERNPFIAFLLNEAKLKTSREELKHLQFQFVASEEFLSEFKIHPNIRTSVYYDPMYPEKRKSALPRQEMVLFRELVGEDLDSQQLLQKVLTMPFYKVVVKRPVKADPILDKPAYQIQSKLVRFDVYYPRSST